MHLRIPETEKPSTNFWGFMLSFRECSFCRNARAFTFKGGTKKWKSFAAPEKRYAGWDVFSFEKSPDFEGVFADLSLWDLWVDCYQNCCQWIWEDSGQTRRARNSYSLWVVYDFAVAFLCVFLIKVWCFRRLDSWKNPAFFTWISTNFERIRLDVGCDGQRPFLSPWMLPPFAT